MVTGGDLIPVHQCLQRHHPALLAKGGRLLLDLAEVRCTISAFTLSGAFQDLRFALSRVHVLPDSPLTPGINTLPRPSHAALLRQTFSPAAALRLCHAAG